MSKIAVLAGIANAEPQQDGSLTFDLQPFAFRQALEAAAGMKKNLDSLMLACDSVGSFQQDEKPLWHPANWRPSRWGCCRLSAMDKRIRNAYGEIADEHGFALRHIHLITREWVAASLRGEKLRPFEKFYGQNEGTDTQRDRIRHQRKSDEPHESLPVPTREPYSAEVLAAMLRVVARGKDAVHVFWENVQYRHALRAVELAYQVLGVRAAIEQTIVAPRPGSSRQLEVDRTCYVPDGSRHFIQTDHREKLVDTKFVI